MVNSKKKGLGKGLGALIGEKRIDLDEPAPATETPPPSTETPAPATEPALPDGTRLLSLDPREIRPNPKQPRHVFDEDALEELAESIKRDGVQEPVIVRPANGGYELVSGERRVRASVLADLERIPAVCREVSDRDMLKLGLIENIQREDLNAIELAEAYDALMREFDYTQEELSEEVGKKRATVANTLRLLHLPDVVQEMVADGSLSMGHARALLAIEDSVKLIKAARRVADEGLSVRQTEKLAAEPAPKPGQTDPAPKKDPNIARLEDDLRRSLGTKVHLKTQKDGKGRIEIDYFSLDELDRLLELLTKKR